MTYDEVLAFYGTQKAAADALGIKQPSVNVWRTEGVPLGRQAQYELITAGALVAERPTPIENQADA